MLASIAIHEAARGTAFQLIDRGYTQSRRSVECPVCGTKYVALLDRNTYRQNSAVGEPVLKAALSYFAERRRQSHNTGHVEQQLVMAPLEGPRPVQPAESFEKEPNADAGALSRGRLK